MTNFFIITGKECNDRKASGHKTKHNPRNVKDIQRKTKKKTGKVTEIEMGLELNHVYWWPETRLTFGGSCPLNALNRRLQQRKHRVHLSQPTVLEYSWFHFSDRREASLLKNTVPSLAIPQLVESIYKWGKRTMFYFKVVLPLLFPHVFCRWQKEIVVHWMERKD